MAARGPSGPIVIDAEGTMVGGPLPSLERAKSVLSTMPSMRFGTLQRSVSMAGNDDQRERLVATVERLTSDDFSREALPGWTVGALLAHLAFWDRLVIERWTRAIADDATIPVSLSDVLTDLINDASVAQWSAMPGPLAGREAVAAAEAVDQYVERLELARIDAAEAAGLGRLVDRSVHRAEHLALIDATLRADRAGR